jgi:hypothetical protein
MHTNAGHPNPDEATPAPCNAIAEDHAVPTPTKGSC